MNDNDSKDAFDLVGMGGKAAPDNPLTTAAGALGGLTPGARLGLITAVT